MLNKVFKYSKHKGRFGGINYLLGNVNRSARPELLRGNEEVTRQLLLQATGEREYTAGVLSFKELAQDVSLDVQNEIMDLYEETLMAGFPRDHYDMMWIRHTDKEGRLELNWHVVNQDLVTGRVLQPYYHKQDGVRLDLAKQIVNDKYGFHSPDDPKNFRDATHKNNFGSRAEIQDRIINQIWAGIESEEINNREDIINLFNDAEWLDVSRVTATGISIKINNNDEIRKPIRFKGGIFSDKFQEGLGSYLQAKEDSAREFSQQREQRLESNKLKLEEYNFRISEKRKDLLVAPAENRRNKLGVNRDNPKPEGSREPENNNIKLEESADPKIHEVNNNNTNAHDNNLGDGNIDRVELVTPKQNLIEIIKQENESLTITTTERSRAERSEISGNKPSRVAQLLKAFADRVQQFFKPIEPAIDRREGEAAELGNDYAELDEKCAELNRLIDRSSGWPPTIEAALKAKEEREIANAFTNSAALDAAQEILNQINNGSDKTPGSQPRRTPSGLKL